MKRKFIVLLILSCLFILLYAQKTPSGAAKQNSSKVTIPNKTLEAKLDSIFSSFNKSTPGIAVTVLQNGKVIAKKAYGLASLEFKVPFTHSTIVRMAYSGGREFIAITAVLMEKDGTRITKIPAGDSLGKLRQEESRCAYKKLEIQPPIFLSIERLDTKHGVRPYLDRHKKLLKELKNKITALRPDVLHHVRA